MTIDQEGYRRQFSEQQQAVESRYSQEVAKIKALKEFVYNQESDEVINEVVRRLWAIRDELQAQSPPVPIDEYIAYHLLSGSSFPTNFDIDKFDYQGKIMETVDHFLTKKLS